MEHSAVQDCAVVGLPDAHWGERVTAVVTLRAAQSTDAAELTAFVKARLGSVKAPKQVEIWSDLPLWLGGDPELEWMDHVDPGPALDAGLALRPLDQTIADTLEWHRRTAGAAGRAGFRMTREREAELLAEWERRGRASA